MDLDESQCRNTLKVAARGPSVSPRSVVSTAGRQLVLSCANAFCWISAVVLCLTAVAKLFSALHGERVLSAADGLFRFWTVREVLVIAAVLEVAEAVLILSGRIGMKLKLQSIFWVGLVFLTYRFGLAAVGFRGYCHCLGEWTTWMRVPQSEVEAAGKVILLWFLGGSSGLLLTWRWWFNLSRA